MPVDGRLHLALGMFDGVHLGHQAVISSLVDNAAEASTAVFTFSPHPSVILRPENPTRMLVPLNERIRALLRSGVDGVIVQPFTVEMAAGPAEKFPLWLKDRFPGLERIHVGMNFRYGKDRKGDGSTLVRDSEAVGLRVHLIPQTGWKGESISSSRIRNHLREGDLHSVRSCLGRLYGFEAVVRQGRQLGRQIGFRTLNLDWEPEVVPPFGVYVVWVQKAPEGAQGKAFPGVANFGVRPTIRGGDAAPVFEVHLLEGGDKFGYGDRIRVQLLDFIRPEQSFGGLDDLQRQIGKDRDRAARILGENPFRANG